ncbi:hypothetical protein OAO01_06855 [Oligoflexia bacterium]|nr:hypothetical protein [Oligoflexia bacterium]
MSTSMQTDQVNAQPEAGETQWDRREFVGAALATLFAPTFGGCTEMEQSPLPKSDQEVVKEFKEKYWRKIFDDEGNRPDYVVITVNEEGMDADQRETLEMVKAMLEEREIAYDISDYESNRVVLEKEGSRRTKDYNLNPITPEIQAKLRGDGETLEGKKLLFVHCGTEYEQMSRNPEFRDVLNINNIFADSVTGHRDADSNWKFTTCKYTIRDLK